MHLPSVKPVFENRYDAGRQLTASLSKYKDQPSVVVLAIPNGGLPVALEVATALEADLDLVISRKIPLPLNPEAGFGAVADDGTVILNDEVVTRMGLTPHQVNYQVNRVRAEIRQRILLYRGNRPLGISKEKTVIIIDDGLASGFTLYESLIIGSVMMFSSTIIGLKLLPTTALHHRHVGQVQIALVKRLAAGNRLRARSKPEDDGHTGVVIGNTLLLIRTENFNSATVSPPNDL